MKKLLELADPRSCLSRAKPTEQLFVLLGRDIAAPATIRFWCNKRLELGKNSLNDKQIQEAFAQADAIEKEQSQ